MFDKIASVLNKRFKILTLMMGVASAPLARAQYVPAENRADLEKTQRNETAFSQKNEDTHKSGVCQASIDEINKLLSDLEKMQPETSDGSKISQVVLEEELKTPKAVDFTLKPETNIVKNVSNKPVEPQKVAEEPVKAQEPASKPEETIAEKGVESAPVAVAETPKVEEKPVVAQEPAPKSEEKVIAKNEDSLSADNQKTVPSKSEPSKKPENNNLGTMVAVGAGLLGGAFLLQRLLKNTPEKPVDEKQDEEVIEDAPFISEKERETIPLKIVPFKKEKKTIAPRKPISLDWYELSSGKDEAELHQKGIRMLGANKIKRAKLRQQKKALTTEWLTADTERKVQIEALLDEIDARGQELSLERRQACVLIRGEQGERDKQQRRLYAKKMAQLRRLTKKDGLDRSAEINEINDARFAMKEAQKQALVDAKKEADARVQQASYKHGLRLLHEAKAEQEELDSLFLAVKKETGLKKKKDILMTDTYLLTRQLKTTQKKRQALKLIKGRVFTRKKIELNKKLKAALADQDISTAEKISNQFIDVQEEQKECVKKAKEFNYGEGRIGLINPTTAQRIRGVRIKRERLKKAHQLRGQRMLYYLYHNQSSAVNNNQISNRAYYQEAVNLLGDAAKTIHVDDYLKQRCTHLKDATLAGIYRRQKQMGRA